MIEFLSTKITHSYSTGGIDILIFPSMDYGSSSSE